MSCNDNCYPPTVNHFSLNLGQGQSVVFFHEELKIYIYRSAIVHEDHLQNFSAIPSTSSGRKKDFN